MNTEIPHLKIERLENGCIRLENESVNGDSYSVDVHPLHVRYLAEQMGPLVREVSATDADMVRMVAKLKRRMLVLQKRIEHLASFLCIHSDSHADLTYEQDYATATADICEEFCADLEDVGNAAGVTPPLQPSHEDRDTLDNVAPTLDNVAPTLDNVSRGTDAGHPSKGSPGDPLTQLELVA